MRCRLEMSEMRFGNFFFFSFLKELILTQLQRKNNTRLYINITLNQRLLNNKSEHPNQNTRILIRKVTTCLIN